MFSEKKEVRFPVKEVIEVIKNNPDKYKVELDQKVSDRGSTLYIYEFEKDLWFTKLFIFPASRPIWSHVFRSKMWYHSDELNWMEDHEKAYLYAELFKLGNQNLKLNEKDKNKQERLEFAKSFGLTVEGQDETN